MTVITPAAGISADIAAGQFVEYDPVFGERDLKVLPDHGFSGVASVPAQRRVAWADLASFTPASGQSLSALEMLREGDLDWNVRLDKTFRYTKKLPGQPPKQVRAKDFAVVREDNEDQLGTVGSRYQVFQNRDIFAFGDSAVKSGKGKWVATGQQGGGAKVFMVMELADEFEVLGDGHKMYLVLRAGHNGLNALRADLAPVRMSCFNQNGLIAQTAAMSWSIIHTTNMQDRLAEAQNALMMAEQYTEAYRDIATRLAAIPVDPERAMKLIKVSMIKRAQADKVAEAAHANWATSMTVGDAARPTGWGLLNGVTEYFGHIIRRDNPNAAFEAAMAGEAHRIRNTLVKNLLRLAA